MYPNTNSQALADRFDKKKDNELYLALRALNRSPVLEWLAEHPQALDADCELKMKVLSDDRQAFFHLADPNTPVLTSELHNKKQRFAETILARPEIFQTDGIETHLQRRIDGLKELMGLVQQDDLKLRLDEERKALKRVKIGLHYAIYHHHFSEYEIALKQIRELSRDAPLGLGMQGFIDSDQTRLPEERYLYSAEELNKPLEEREIRLDEVEKHLADLVARRQVVRDLVGVTESSHALLQALPVLDVQPPKNFIARRIFDLTQDALQKIRGMHQDAGRVHIDEEYYAAVHPEIVKKYEAHLDRLIEAIKQHVPLSRQAIALEAAGFPACARSGYFNEKIKPDQFALQVKSMAEGIYKSSRKVFSEWDSFMLVENPDQVCTYFKDYLNGVTNFVHKHILEHETLKGRACALEFWIHVAHKLLEFGDYNTAMILEAGLQSPVITTKLPRSSHAISDAAKLKVEELASYRLKNSAQLRSAIACDPTAIPDTGLMSKDVIMIVQNHKATLYEHPIIQSKLADLPMRQAMLQSPENDDPQVSAMTQMLKAQADNTSNKELYAVGSQYEDVEKEKSVGTSRLDSRLKRVNTLLSEPLEKAEPTLHLDDEEEAKRIEEISRGLRFATMQSITRAMQHIIENQPFKLSNRYAGLAKSLSELVNLAHYADPISHQVAELKRQLLDLENACGADAASLQELFGGFRRDATEKHDQYRRLLQMNVTLLLKGVIAELESYPTLEERKKIARGDILSILRLNIELDPATQLTPENAALFERFQTLQNSLIASLPNMAENYPEMQAPPAAPMTVKDSIEHWVSQALHHSREHLQEDPTYHYSRTRLNDTIHTQFTDESHALVCTRDYDDMIQHYLNAANTIFTEMYGEDNQQIKDRIQACYDELREELLRECDIDPLMRAYKQECYSTIPVGLTNESHYQKQILEKIELASQYGRKFIAFAVRELYPDSIRGPKDFDKAAQIFVARANDLTAEKARPRLIHEFTVNVNGKHGTQCLSLHEPIQEKTISSQVRAPGELANAGRRSFAVKTGDNVEVVFTARTHCSLSPNTGSKAYTSRWQQLTTRHGALCESIKRRHSTYEALLELIQRIAQDQVDRLPEGAVVGTKDSPLPLNMSSMCLMTGTRFDNLLTLKSNETVQIQDILLAIGMARNHPVEVTVMVKGEPKTITTQPNMNFMSETCNILGSVFGASEAVDQINDKGYAEYTQMAYTHCLESLPNTLPNDAPIDVPGRGKLFMAERLRQSVGNVLAQYQAPWDELQRKLGKIDLDEQYTTLFKCQEAYLQAYQSEAWDSEVLSDLAKKYDAAFRQIQATEHKQHGYYKTFVEQQWKITKDSRLRDPNLRDDLRKYLLDNHQALSPDDRDTLTLFQALEDSCSLYNGEQDKMNRLMYEFQSRYILVSHLCGREVDFYCMSACDRTGREQQFIEEMLIFRDQFGYMPQIETKKSRILSHTMASKNPADDLEQRKIALKVHERSTSRSIAEMNRPGGRAIKVDGKYSKKIGPVNLKLKRVVAANTDLPVKIERKFSESIQKSQRKLTLEDRLLGIDDVLNPAIRQILHDKLPEDLSILQTDKLVRKLNDCFAMFQIQNALKEFKVPISEQDEADIKQFRHITSQVKRLPEAARDYIVHNVDPVQLLNFTDSHFADIRAREDDLDFIASYSELAGSKRSISIDPTENFDLSDDFVYPTLTAIAMVHQQPLPTDEAWLSKMRDYVAVSKMDDESLRALISEGVEVEHLGQDELDHIREEARVKWMKVHAGETFPETEHLLRRSRTLRQSAEPLLVAEDGDLAEHDLGQSPPPPAKLAENIAATRRSLERLESLEQLPETIAEMREDLQDEVDLLGPLGGSQDLEDELREVDLLTERLLPEAEQAPSKARALITSLGNRISQFFHSLVQRRAPVEAAAPPVEEVTVRFRLGERLRRIFHTENTPAAQQPVPVVAAQPAMVPVDNPVMNPVEPPVERHVPNPERNRAILGDLDVIRRSAAFRLEPDPAIDLLHSTVSDSVARQVQSMPTHHLFQREREPMRFKNQPAVSLKDANSAREPKVSQPSVVQPNRVDFYSRHSNLLSTSNSRVEVKSGVRNYFSPLIDLSTNDHMHNPLFNSEVKLLVDMLRDLVIERVQEYQQGRSTSLKKEVVISGHDTHTLVGVAAALVQASGFKVRWETPELEAQVAGHVNVDQLKLQYETLPEVQALLADLRQVEATMAPNRPESMVEDASEERSSFVR